MTLADYERLSAVDRDDYLLIRDAVAELTALPPKSKSTSRIRRPGQGKYEDDPPGFEMPVYYE